jgi:hypothetical protein
VPQLAKILRTANNPYQREGWRGAVTDRLLKLVRREPEMLALNDLVQALNRVYGYKCNILPTVKLDSGRKMELAA